MLLGWKWVDTNAVRFLYLIEECDAEKSTFIWSLHELSFCFLSHSLSRTVQKGKLCVSEKHCICTTFAEKHSLNSLMLTDEHIFSIILLTSWSLLRQCLAKFNTLAALEGKVSNKNVVGFITLFSCQSLLSVVWDYRMLDYSIFRGCCEEKASGEKWYIKINYHQ